MHWHYQGKSEFAKYLMRNNMDRKGLIMTAKNLDEGKQKPESLNK